MPSTARQLRQPPTIEAIGRVLYFADIIRRLKIRNAPSMVYNCPHTASEAVDNTISVVDIFKK